MRIYIENGHVIDPANELDGVQDLYCAEGRIVALGTAPDGFQTDLRIEATNCIVMPGIVDLCARLREPGQEHKGTISSETRAAAAGGITTLCIPPDTQPVIDTPAVLELLHQRAEAAGYAHVVGLGALTTGLDGEHLSEMAELKKAGCVGISNGAAAVINTLVMRRAMEYAASHDLTVFLRAEDQWLAKGGCAHEGTISMRLGLPGIPETAETIAVGRELLLIEQTGVRAHFHQLSTARAVQMISRAQHEGLPVTTDVTSHHLHLTHMDIGYFNGNCHLRPPLRTQRDCDGLRMGLQKGSVSAICSDHQPHDADAKFAPFSETEPGISTLETLLPLCFRMVDEGLLSMSQLVTKLTVQPARILRLDAGTLSINARADICVFDPQRHWQVDPDTLLSAGHNTPFMGWEMKGRVRYTLLDGKVVHALKESCESELSA